MFPRLAPVTAILIIANVLAYGVEKLDPGWALGNFALWPWNSVTSPASAPFEFWQLVTYGFLHEVQNNNYAHIFFNMFALFMFGSDIERSMGAKRYVIYYFVCVIGAGLAQLLVTAFASGPPAYTVGASGAVFGILLAFAIAFPYRKLIVFPIPVPLPAWLFVTLYGALELTLGVLGTQQGVAHFAHLGGMAGGYLLILYWRHARR